MDLPDSTENVLMALIDRAAARLLRRRPVPPGLAECRVIAHRGAHGPGRPENTLAAFDAAASHGVWGIEFDIRWTRDLVPVVAHDPGLGRVFGLEVLIGRLTAAELKRRCPHVPTLAEVLERYRRRLHLMIEIKSEADPEPERRDRIVGEHLARGGFEPVRDYHVLSLSSRVLEGVRFAPPAACVPVARWNLGEFSRAALRRGWGGVAGHYAVVGARTIERHHGAGQKVGTGYIRSPGVLRREVGRGVDWVFTNDAAAVMGMTRG